MARHVRFLAILYSLWGGLFVLAGAALLILAAGAASIAWMPAQPTTGGFGLAAGVTAATFVVVGLMSLLWGTVHLWCGTKTRRHEPWGRTLALGLAVLNCVLLPFGTALGIYTAWVLLTPDGRRLFEERDEVRPSQSL